MSEQQTHNGHATAERRRSAAERERQAEQATLAWDDRIHGIVVSHWEEQKEIIAGALAETTKNVCDKLEAAIKVATLEVLPEAMRQRELTNKAIADAVDKLRDEIRAEMRTNLRLVLLEQGFMPRVRGTWTDGESYSALDIVMSDGTCWIAKVSSPGPLPGEGWQILSCKGERGRPGPIGPRGEVGPEGPRGPMGEVGLPAPRITKWAIDRKRFVAIPVMSSGEPGPELELRRLFEEFQSQTT
jgi:hypothetical protein